MMVVQIIYNYYMHMLYLCAVSQYNVYVNEGNRYCIIMYTALYTIMDNRAHHSIIHDTLYVFYLCSEKLSS